MKLLLQYIEPLTESARCSLSPTLKAKLLAELHRDKARYTVNNKLSEAEVQRSALRVFFLLRESHPELFQQLRDSNSEDLIIHRVQ